MSAFEVCTTHIDALLTAGLQWATTNRSPIRWLARELTQADQEDAYERGAPWGPEAIRLYGELQRELTVETAGHVGAMLLAENRASVNHRYDEAEWEEPYQFHRLPGTADPVIVLSALSCYEYQSCEHPEWQDSEARRFCDSLRASAIRELPGYDSAPWEISDRNVFLRRPR